MLKKVSAGDFKKLSLNGYEATIEMWGKKALVRLDIFPTKPTELPHAEYETINAKLHFLQDNKDKILKQVVSESFEERLNRSLTREQFTASLKVTKLILILVLLIAFKFPC